MVEVVLIAKCISCKDEREIDEKESETLTRTHSVPMCEKCGMPMVATKGKMRK